MVTTNVKNVLIFVAQHDRYDGNFMKKYKIGRKPVNTVWINYYFLKQYFNKIDIDHFVVNLNFKGNLPKEVYSQKYDICLCIFNDPNSFNKRKRDNFKLINKVKKIINIPFYLLMESINEEKCKMLAPTFDSIFVNRSVEEYMDVIQVGSAADKNLLFPDKDPNVIRILVDHPAYTQKHFEKKDQSRFIIQSIFENKFKKPVLVRRFSDRTVETVKDSKIDINLYSRAGVNILDAYNEYRKADIFFVTHPESMGLSVIECAMAGCLIVTPKNYIKPIFLKGINYIEYDKTINWTYVLNKMNAVRSRKMVMDRSWESFYGKIFDSIEQSFVSEFILVTGGLGYIGSHICVELIRGGHDIVIVDNLVNSKIGVLDKIKYLAEKDQIYFYEKDIRDKPALKRIFEVHNIKSVIHLAGLKSVNVSIDKPVDYYENNVEGTITLIDSMRQFDCKKIIFSSSATVYGNQQYPVTEEAKTGEGITTPYGRSKHMIEKILEDLYISDNSWSIVILRYFNPVGAHSSGLLGEDPNDVPNNLFPIILQTANGKYNMLNIYGNDYDTSDGTCVRDFIHVVDLALGHIKAVTKLEKAGHYIYNLGTGKPVSVLQFIEKFIEINDIHINYVFADRRPGDLPEIYADTSKAEMELDWKAHFTLDDICKDGWQFLKKSLNNLN